MKLVNKKCLLLLCLLCSSTGYSTIITHDPVLTAKTAADEVVNFAKFAETATKETQVALNTLRTYENTVLQVARFGNPAALRALPGVSTIAELYQTYSQLQQDYFQIQSMANPRNLQGDFNYVLSSYRYPTWQGYTTASGMTLAPNPGLYQFATSDYNIGRNLTDQLTQLDQKKATLTQQRDQVLQLLQSATTDAEVKKYHAILDGLNAAIADVNQSEAQLYNRGQIQQKQNASAQQIYQASQVEQRQMQELQTVDAGLNGLPTGDMDRPALWGSSR